MPITSSPLIFDFGIFAFSWSKENGIGLTQTSYSTVRPIDFYCEVPEEIRRGECVGKFIFDFFLYYIFYGSLHIYKVE